MAFNDQTEAFKPVGATIPLRLAVTARHTAQCQHAQRRCYPHLGDAHEWWGLVPCSQCLEELLPLRREPDAEVEDVHAPLPRVDSMQEQLVGDGSDVDGVRECCGDASDALSELLRGGHKDKREEGHKGRRTGGDALRVAYSEAVRERRLKDPQMDSSNGAALTVLEGCRQ